MRVFLVSNVFLFLFPFFPFFSAIKQGGGPVDDGEYYGMADSLRSILIHCFISHHDSKTEVPLAKMNRVIEIFEDPIIPVRPHTHTHVCAHTRAHAYTNTLEGMKINCPSVHRFVLFLPSIPVISFCSLFSLILSIL